MMLSFSRISHILALSAATEPTSLTPSTTPDIQLPLDAWHRSRGASMGSFAGYALPMRYGSALEEHMATRQHAALFDVSHMPQWCWISTQSDGALAAVKRLLTVSPERLRPGRCVYGFMLRDNGGIVDDLIVTNTLAPHHTPPSDLSRAHHGLEHHGERVDFVVVSNGGQRADVAIRCAHDIQQHGGWKIVHASERCLLALQGPRAHEVLSALGVPDLASMRTMTTRHGSIDGIACWINRSGYTGEDGFEISVHRDHVVELAERLLSTVIPVTPAGLIARDSLRIEAGLPLYGHELTLETNPFEAGQSFAIPNDYLEGDAAFCGVAALRQARSTLAASSLVTPMKKLVGLVLDDQVIARAGATVHLVHSVGKADDTHPQPPVGVVTSGIFSPVLQKSIALAYIRSNSYTSHASENTASGTLETLPDLAILVRNQLRPARVVALPFVAKRPYRGAPTSKLPAH